MGSLRLYFQVAEDSSLELVAKLCALTEVSITKSRAALVASNNVSAALMWLRAPKRPSESTIAPLARASSVHRS